MSKPVKILVIDDSGNDADLAVRSLQRGGFDPQFERVDSGPAIQEALTRQSWDAVIADYRMPNFTGLEALKIVRAHDFDIPFILVSGDVGEEIAVDAMKAGANDFVGKQNLSRLASVLSRELGEAANRANHRLAQRKLTEGEAGLRRAQIIAKLAHAITGPDGSFETWSESLPPLIGVAPGETPKSTRAWLELVHPDDRALFRDTSIEAGRLGTGASIEYRVRHANGAWIHVRHVMERIDAAAGEAGPMRWFNTLQDVTDQKRADREIQRFRMAMDVSPDSMYLTDPATMRFVYLNNTACQRLGYSRDRLLQMDVHEVLTIGRERLSRGYEQVIAAGDRGLVQESPFAQSDGTKGWAEIHSRALRTGDGTLIITIGRNITERKRADEQIRRLNRVYAVLSGINALLVRVQDRDELFREACRIAVEAGGFGIAWIGLLDRKMRRLRPVAWQGIGAEHAPALETGVGEDAPERGTLAAQAMRDARAVISNDIEHDSRIRLKAEMLAAGLRSVIVLPLLVSGEAVGTLTLVAAEAGFFDEAEVKLLTELAGDIAFALDHLEKANRLDYLAYYDSLTGLANRSLFHERLGQFLATAANEESKLAVLVIDLERFRSVNETLGRQAGDGLLAQIADRARRVMTDPNWLARIGPDQFASATPGVTSSDAVVRRIEQRLREIFGEPFKLGETEVRISARCGIAIFPDDGTDADALLRNAEAALRKAKSSGDRYLFYAQEMTARVAENLALENQLRHALEREQFVLHYQPKVDLETRRIVGVEALIRWNSPERGLVPPGLFIPLLEETGLILQVGAWALKRAVLDHRGWVEQGIPACRIAVNVSAIQLRQKDFVSVVERTIDEGIAPTGIDLEITESLLMEDIAGNIRKLQALSDLGMRISIDDFGTGYSSLGYLAKLPVHTLKIDRSFIIAMLSDPDTMTLVSTMISLAHSLRLTVVAEGVEQEDQGKVLRLLRCDEIQGYLISRPVPFDQMTALLQQGKQA